MKMLLRPEFLNGYFGDPALYIWELNAKRAILMDCGDLSHFSTRHLLKVSHLFLSHCHIDHFYGFDQFLRVHVGSEKNVTIMGPPETCARVAGKLQGYTWNLISDQNLEFVAVDLDTRRGEKQIMHFHARDRFQPSRQQSIPWDPHTPAFDGGTFHVNAVTLDHRTPSMAYSIEEKMTVAINSDKLNHMGFKSGPWLNQLKSAYLAGETNSTVEALMKGGTYKNFKVADLIPWLLVPRQRHKIVYSTDGAAHGENEKALLSLVRDADIYFSETCFLEADREIADDTKHFTAAFIGGLAERARVKRLVPFHFSKRYVGHPGDVLNELSHFFTGEIIELKASSETGSVHEGKQEGP